MSQYSFLWAWVLVINIAACGDVDDGPGTEADKVGVGERRKC
jgi:hypothetical protein